MVLSERPFACLSVCVCVCLSVCDFSFADDPACNFGVRDLKFGRKLPFYSVT